MIQIESFYISFIQEKVTYATNSISDNVTLNIDGVLYLRVRDPYKASYGVEDPEFAITQLAQTTMRSEIGKITLDTLFRERNNLNAAIVEAINQVRHVRVSLLVKWRGPSYNYMPLLTFTNFYLIGKQIRFVITLCNPIC